MTITEHLSPAQASANLPLAVDLDGTLIRCDLFFEGIMRFLFAAPWKLPLLIGWLLKGRAHAKARVAEAHDFDPALLPYDERVLTWLKAERSKGRTLVLATACDRRAAQKVAEHLDLFDAVFASDGRVNLKAARKAERLAAAFPGGFAYAGNERADVAVWRSAASAVVANAPPGILAAANRAFAVERNFPRQTSAARALVKAMRPQQWAKNFLVFVPIIAGQGWAQWPAWAAAAMAFWALSFTASAVYLLNDAADIDADRGHPRKRGRPFASGALSPAWGLGGAAALGAVGLWLAARADVLGLTLAYLGATTLYSLWLKRVELLDVFLLANLYTLRIVVGGAASGFHASDWLLAFSCFFFLSLALVKRAAETRDLANRGGGDLSRRGYVSADTDILSMMGLSAGFVSALVLALYLQDAVITAHYQAPLFLWALPGAVLFFVCRLWLKVSRGQMRDDPLVFAAHDPWSWATGLVAGAGFLAAATLGAPVTP